MRPLRLRFTILWLVALVSAIGIELASLRSDSAIWNAVPFNLTTAILVFACLAARYGGEGVRDWWFGFAVFGFVQFVFGMVVVYTEAADSGSLPTHWINLELMNLHFPRLASLCH